MGDSQSPAEAILFSAEMVEELAAIEHERWAHWQEYLHARCEQQPDGSLTIPPDLVAHWTRQIETPYSELTDDEKESDREQVLRYLATVAGALR